MDLNQVSARISLLTPIREDMKRFHVPEELKHLAIMSLSISIGAILFGSALTLSVTEDNSSGTAQSDIVNKVSKMHIKVFTKILLMLYFHCIVYSVQFKSPCYFHLF